MKKITFTALTLLLVSFHSFSQGPKENGGVRSVNNTGSRTSGNALVLLSPSNDMQFNGSDGNKPILFRWTAIVPKPKEAVTYRLKVWQLMQGQNGAEAMKSNQPIITKDVINITQVAISNLYTGPCKPPYLCDFIWSVQIINTAGQDHEATNGANEASVFRFISNDQSDLSMVEFVKIKTSDKKVWKIRKQDIEIFNPKTLICYCDHAHTIVVPCDNMESCFSGDPIEPFGPLWYLEIGKQVSDDINAQLQKMGMRLKGNNKSLDKELDKSQPTKSIQNNSNQGDPVHGVDVKPGLKTSGKRSELKKPAGSPKSTNNVSYDLKADKRV